jgi:hypothetical protein
MIASTEQGDLVSSSACQRGWLDRKTIVPWRRLQGAAAIYVCRLELSGSPGPRVLKYERGHFCVSKFFVSD